MFKDAAYSLRRVPSIASNFLAFNSKEKPDNHSDLGTLPFAHLLEPMLPTHQHCTPDTMITGSQFPLVQYEIKPVTSPTFSEEDGGHSDYSKSLGDISPLSSSSPNHGRFASAVCSVMILQNASPHISPFATLGRLAVVWFGLGLGPF